ncbi:MAG: diguanylate cyclase [Deltaproteobacteria bacterium]|nr:diguanylate cyclase [Deltaproteobacteria bacterium]
MRGNDGGGGDEEERTGEIDVASFQQSVGRLEVRGAVVVVLSGARMGSEIRLDGPEVTVGRDGACGVWLPDDGVSRVHARLCVADDGTWVVEDNGSTNGTAVNGVRVSRQTLRDGDRLLLGRTVVRFFTRAAVDDDYSRRVQELSVRDALTKVYNRRFLDDRLAAEVAYARRHGTSLSLLMIDIDHFKAVNDLHGHPVGDEVLRQVAAELRRRLRAEDILARYGGEEFCVLARGIEAQGALVMAERLRKGVESLVVHLETAIRVTVSIGAATAAGGPDLTEATLVEEADRLLYRAKNAGRNRSCGGMLPREPGGVAEGPNGSTPGRR